MSVVSKFLKSTVLSIATVILLVGCDFSKNDKSSTQNVRNIKVGTYPAIPKISFYDEKGNLTGFDVELVRELGKRLPQYNFEFSTMEFPQLFLSLDAQRLDLIAMHLEKNKAREEKYLFNEEAYDWSRITVGVNRNRTDITSLNDLGGKKVVVSAGANEATLIEDFNRDNPNPAQIVYSASFEDIVKQLKTGRVDATLIDTELLKDLNQKVNAQLKPVGSALQGTTGIYFAMRKGDTTLVNDLDEAVRSMKKDGSLERLSKQWLDHNNK